MWAYICRLRVGGCRGWCEGEGKERHVGWWCGGWLMNEGKLR
jgi:hypothetical protein